MSRKLKIAVERNHSLLIASLAILGVVSLPQAAMAQDAGGAFAPIQTAVQLIVDFITGPFGRTLAVLAVIGLGIAAFAGKISWIACGFVVIGIGLVFGAPQIVDQLISSVGS